MFGLNEKGWGYKFLIFFAVLFVLILIGVSIALHKLGWTKNSLGKKNSNSQNSEYVSIENNLQSSGYLYLKENKNYIDNSNSSVKVSLDTLMRNGYSNNLIDPVTGNFCNGYVIISVNSEVSAYIKCDNYETENYRMWSR